MKRILTFAALAALTLASCQKSEPVSQKQESIGFSVYTGRAVTKANVTDVTTATLDSFKVASYLTGKATKYFTAEETAKKGTTVWATANTYYWPVSEALDFFAYKSTASLSISNTSGAASISYTAPANATDDFVVAYAIGKKKSDIDETNKALAITFNHALAKISGFTFTPSLATTVPTADKEKYKFYVEEITISSINAGTFTFPTTDATALANTNWTISTVDTTNYTKTYTDKLTAGNSTLSIGATDGRDVVLLPQTVKISIKYYITFNDVKIQDSTTKTGTVDLTISKNYNIKATLSNDASPIQFTAEVTAWETATDADITIN